MKTLIELWEYFKSELVSKPLVISDGTYRTAIDYIHDCG